MSRSHIQDQSNQNLWEGNADIIAFLKLFRFSQCASQFENYWSRDSVCSFKLQLSSYFLSPKPERKKEAALLFASTLQNHPVMGLFQPASTQSRLPQWLSGKEPACRCRRRGFDPWVGNIPQSRKWQPTPVFLPEEFPWTEEPGGLQSIG